MAATKSKTEQAEKRKLRRKLREKRNRRKDNLIKKAYEYSAMCDADVCLGIRLEENGRVFTFCSDPLECGPPWLPRYWYTYDPTYVSIAIAAGLTMILLGLIIFSNSTPENREGFCHGDK
jgi:SRF-type transcription factor (DNA-binding and dimerisation domain)